MDIREGAVIAVPDDQVGETVIDEIFDAKAASRYFKAHSLASRCDKFIGRDAGDNLVVMVGGEYVYWDHSRDLLIPLGKSPSAFVTGYDE